MSTTVAHLPRPDASAAVRSEGFYLNLVRGRRPGLMAGMLRAALTLASMPYAVGVTVRNRLYDWGWKRRERAQVPVVSIGNLTLGGTGKTPAVEYAARFYRRLGLRVAILSRGYGSAAGRNDEALVLEENLPDVRHLQGVDRVALATIAVEKLASEVLILDDGFQHRRLHRDLDIVLVDATDPWGGGRLFPRGLLREPCRSLKRAGLVLLTRCDQVAPEELKVLREQVARMAPEAPLAESIHEPVHLAGANREAPLELLRGRPVGAFCGIGNPHAFRQTLEALGSEVMAWEVFPDHHRYTREDVERLERWAGHLPPDALVATTQKDLVKLRRSQLGGRPLWAVRIALRPTAGQEGLDRKLEGVLA